LKGAVQQHPYSVPHALLREQVDTRITTRTIEIFHRGKRVASHARRYGGPRHGTLPDHMHPGVMPNGRRSDLRARRVTSAPTPRR
jgi:hypothetical protein